MYILSFTVLVSLLIVTYSSPTEVMPPEFDYISNIDPSIIIQPRYAIPGNFVGEVIDGYLAQKAVISKKAGYALANVQSDLRILGYSLVVYDAYRPQKAVDHFIRWSNQIEDNKTKAEFYPYLDKKDIIPLGYVATKSGHSRGGTVDLTIIPIGQKVHEIKLFEQTLTDGTKILYRDDGTAFTCSHFDFFGEVSHPDTGLIDESCRSLRDLLRSVMEKHGFIISNVEWWHFRLKAEPFPDTYFDFDIV